MTEQAIHASAVLFGERAVILRGPPGSGKSRLALALIARATPSRPALLVGDDRIIVRAAGGRLVVRGHPAIAGHIELRGAGIISVPWTARAVAGLIVDCAGAPERLPEPGALFDEIAGIRLPRCFVDPGAGDVVGRVETLAGIAGDHAAWEALGEYRAHAAAVGE